jgi:hypothetical protein
MLRQAEADLYAQMFTVEAYSTHSPGEVMLPVFLDMSQAAAPATILDAGCGSGKGALALGAKEFDVAMCDHTAEGLPDGLSQTFPFVKTCLWDDLSHVAYLAKVQQPTVFNGETFEYGYCCDVLEHIPIPFTMLVVRRILDRVTRGAFFSVSLAPDHMGYWVGTRLHQSIPSVTFVVPPQHNAYTYWRSAFNEVGTVIESRDLLTTGVYYVSPKR